MTQIPNKNGYYDQASLTGKMRMKWGHQLVYIDMYIV